MKICFVTGGLAIFGLLFSGVLCAQARSDGHTTDAQTSSLRPSGQDTGSPKARPRVGLVLEGGGALGLAHVGVIRWLEENHIRST